MFKKSFLLLLEHIRKIMVVLVFKIVGNRHCLFQRLSKGTGDACSLPICSLRNTFSGNLLLILFIPLFIAHLTAGVGAGAAELPVKIPAPAEWKEIPYRGITNLLAIETIHSCIKSGNDRGLFLDFSGIRNLLDGTVLNSSDTVYGKVYLGPYPFEANEVTYTYKRFKMEITFDQGYVVLPVAFFLSPLRNSEEWKNEGQLVVRLDLYLSSGNNTRSLGLYDTFVCFKREVEPTSVKFVKQTSIIEGPLVNLSMSDDPSTLIISFKTDQSVMAAVVLNNGRTFSSAQASRKHEITVTGLEAAQDLPGGGVHAGDRHRPPR